NKGKHQFKFELGWFYRDIQILGTSKMLGWMISPNFIKTSRSHKEEPYGDTTRVLMTNHYYQYCLIFEFYYQLAGDWFFDKKKYSLAMWNIVYRPKDQRGTARLKSSILGSLEAKFREDMWLGNTTLREQYLALYNISFPLLKYPNNHDIMHTSTCSKTFIETIAQCFMKDNNALESA
ncbi:hypothetical protein ACJX0J_026091, partial [Zea mays]